MKKNEASEVSTDSQGSSHQAQDSQHFIGDYHSAPHFMKDNDKIHTGYRINFNSISKLFRSLFMVHNEVVNIWSHLLPLLVFIVLLISFWMVIDDYQFKMKMSEHKEDFDKAFQEYQASIRNLTLAERIEGMSKQKRAEIEQIKLRIVSKYEQIMEKVSQKSTELQFLLNQDIEGVGHSFKDDLKAKIYELEKYKSHYENSIAPRIVEAVQSRLDSKFFISLKKHATDLKNHLDSNIFQQIELHPEAPNPQLISRWPIFVFLSTAVLCLLFSTVFHLFHPLSIKTYGLLLRFDFAGISLLIAGSAFPPFYYSLYCHFAVAEIYLTCSVAAALICFVISLFEFIHRRENIRYRAVVFGTFGLSMVIPLTHLVVNQFVFDNFGDPFRFSSSYPYYIALIMSYCIGLYIFIVKCPERNNPGKYDICGHSHQIWHFLVVLGIIFTLYGCLQNYEMRKQSICPA